MGGLGFRISEGLSLDVQYRFMITGGYEEGLNGGVTLSTDYNPHSFLVGLRKSF